jgi:hypothetical protein
LYEMQMCSAAHIRPEINAIINSLFLILDSDLERKKKVETYNHNLFPNHTRCVGVHTFTDWRSLNHVRKRNCSSLPPAGVDPEQSLNSGQRSRSQDAARGSPPIAAMDWKGRRLRGFSWAPHARKAAERSLHLGRMQLRVYLGPGQ